MRKMFGSLARFIVRFPKTVIAATVVLTLVLGYGMGSLKMDSDLTDDIPSTIPEKAFYDEVGKIFPSDDVLIIAFSDSQGAWSSRSLAQVKSWTDTISGMEDIKSVLSLSNATVITGTGEGIVIEQAMTTLPETAEELAAFRQRLETAEIASALVGRDGKASAMMISVAPGTDTVRRPRFRISLHPSSGADTLSALVSALEDLKDAEGNPAFESIHAGGDRTDRFDAASCFNEFVGTDPEGRTLVLAVPSGTSDPKELLAAVTAIADPLKAKASFTDSQVSMYDRMNAAISLLPQAADGKVYISGSKAVSSVIGKLMISDLGVLFPVVVILIVLILFLSFRTLRGVILPLVNVIMATVMAMGFMGWTGQPISMATMVLPIILIAVGTAYAIHVINRYYEDLAAIDDKKEAIVSTLEHVSVPILLAALTTMIGFASLAVSSISALRVYGLLAALGIFFALFLAVTFTPALLLLLAKPARKTVESRNGGALVNLLDAVGRLTTRKPRLVLGLCVFIVAVAAVGIPFITFESNTVESFRKNSGIRESSEYLNDNFTGITIMTIVVQAAEDGAILDPAVLLAMDGLQTELETLRFSGKRLLVPGDKGYDEGSELVGGTQSITSFVRGINKAMHADDPAWDKVPDAVTEVSVTTEKYAYRNGTLVETDSQYGDALRTLVEGTDFTVEGSSAFFDNGGMQRRVSLDDGSSVDLVPGRIFAGQLVFQYENSGDPANIESFIDNPRKTARINVFLRTGSSTVSGAVQSWTRKYIDGHFPSGVRADITGLSALNLTIQRLLINTQIASVISSLLIILVMISLLSRSVIEGLFSIIPLSASLVINFGIMGLAGIPVDISTATIASIAIGIGIDYTLHFMERFKYAASSMDIESAVIATLRTTGLGIIYNALAVAGGFVALMFSQIRGNFYMGLLMAIIMVVASTFALTLLPAVLVTVKPAFVKKLSHSNQEDVI